MTCVFGGGSALWASALAWSLPFPFVGVSWRSLYDNIDVG